MQSITLPIECKGMVNFIEDGQIGITVTNPLGGHCDLVLSIEMAEELQEGDFIIYRIFYDEQGILQHTLAATEPPRMTAEEEAEIDRLIDDLVKRLDGYF